MKYWNSSWNPITGCGAIKISEGCAHCYAEDLVNRRWVHNKKTHYYTVGFKPAVKWYALELPKVPKGQVIFVSDMGDPIGLIDFWREGFWLETKDTKIPRPMTEADAHRAINRLLNIVRDRPTQQFLLLTKRPKALPIFDLAIPNLWVGTTICNQDEVWKLDWLLKSNAINRWLSIEPMLTAVTFDTEKLKQVHWVVCGGENYRDLASVSVMEPEWTRQLLDECRVAGVPFFFKQAGSFYQDDQDDSDFQAVGAVVRERPTALQGAGMQSENEQVSFAQSVQLVLT